MLHEIAGELLQGRNAPGFVANARRSGGTSGKSCAG